MSLLLTDEQLAAGTATLSAGKLTPSQVSDLVSIFRGYLGTLASNYSIESTLTAEDDDDSGGAQKCAKLAACLALFQDNQFESGGIDPTSREGIHFSISEESFEIFKYAFGLFWDIPAELWNQFKRPSGARTSLQGRVITPAQLPHRPSDTPWGSYRRSRSNY